MAAVNKRNQEE